MKILDLKQGSPEWLAARFHSRTASEASVMMGASKKLTRNDLVRMKATGAEQEFSDWVRENLLDKGHEIEAAARPMAEAILEDELYPAVATTDDGYLMGSYDGLTMLEEDAWECKSWNEAKAAVVREGRVPDEDYWQIVQQIAIGVPCVLYMVTDGTPEKRVSITLTHTDVAQDIPRLMAGWRQLDEDVANYQHVEDQPKPEGRAPDTLPALHIEVTGAVTSSNLREFRESAMAVINAIKTDLQTDEDFADAEKTVKWCGDVEKRLDASKDHALGQTKTIDELFRTMDAIKAETRAKRLELEKLVKARKEAIRAEILYGAKDALGEHLASLNDRLGKPYFSLRTFVMTNGLPPDFAGAMRSKKTIKSLRDGVDQVLADAKIRANSVADAIQINLKEFQVLAAAFKFLFSDIDQLVHKAHDDFVAAVKLRISDHHEAEAKREAEQRERIAAEERARIEREERAKIEAEQRAQVQRERKEQACIAAEQRDKAAQQSTGNDAEATRADGSEDQRPQAPASSTRPYRPSDAEIVRAVACAFGVDDKTAWGWIENFGQEDAA